MQSEENNHQSNQIENQIDLKKLIQAIHQGQYSSFSLQSPSSSVDDSFSSQVPTCSSSTPSSSDARRVKKKKRTPPQSLIEHALLSASIEQLVEITPRVSRELFSCVTGFDTSPRRIKHLVALLEYFAEASRRHPLTAADHPILTLAQRLQLASQKVLQSFGSSKSSSSSSSSVSPSSGASHSFNATQLMYLVKLFTAFFPKAIDPLLAAPAHALLLKSCFKAFLQLFHASLTACKPSHRSSCFSAFLSALSPLSEPSLVALFPLVVAEAHPYSLAAFSHVVAQHRPQLLQQFAAPLLQHFVDLVVLSPVLLDRQIIRASHPWLSSLSPADLQTLLQAIARALKRNPETSIEHLAHFIRATQLLQQDKFFALQLLPAIVAAFDSASDQLKQMAARLMHQIVQAIADLPLLQATAQAVFTVANKQAPFLMMISELVHALPAPNHDDALPVIQHVLSHLAPLAKKETNPEPRGHYLSALCLWLRRAATHPEGASSCAASLTLLGDWAAGSEALLPSLAAHLPAEVQAFPQRLLDAVVAHVNACQAPLKVAALVHAVRAAGRMRSFAQVRPLSNNLWNVAYLPRFAQPDLLALAEVCQFGLLHDNQDVPVIDMLLTLVLHQNAKVSQAALRVVSRYCALSDTALTHTFLSDFLHKLLTLVFTTTTTTGALSISFAERLLAFLDTDLIRHISATSMASILVILHHPLLASTPSSLHHHHHASLTNWHRFRHRLGVTSMFCTLEDDLIANCILSHTLALFAQNPECSPLRTAIATSLASLVATTNSETLTRLLNAHLSPFAQALVADVAVIPSQSLPILLLPRGVYYNPDARFVATSRGTAKVLSDQELWEQQVASRNVSSAPQLNDDQKKQLEAQDQLRATLQPLLTRTAFLFQLLQTLAINVPSAVHHQLTSIVPFIIGLLKFSPLYVNATYLLPALTDVMATVPHPFRKYSSECAVLIYRCALDPQLTDLPQIGQEAFEQMFFRFFDAEVADWQNFQLSGSSLAVLLPLFNHMLTFQPTLTHLPSSSSSSSTSPSPSSSSSPSPSSSSSSSSSANDSSTLSDSVENAAIEQESILPSTHRKILSYLLMQISQFTPNDILVDWNRLAHILLALYAKYPAYRPSTTSGLFMLAPSLIDLSELLDGIIHSDFKTRHVSLSALLQTRYLNGRARLIVKPHFPLYAIPRFLMATHDIDPENVELAKQLAERYSYDIDVSHLDELFIQLFHSSSDLRQMAALAILSATQSLGSQFSPSQALSRACTEYNAHMPRRPSKKKNSRAAASTASTISEAALNALADARAGCAQLIGALAPALDMEQTKTAFNFIAVTGLLDPHPTVADPMIDAGCALTRAHHTTLLDWFLKVTEDKLSAALDTSEYDLVRESLVIFLGNLAQYFEASDERILRILDQLTKTLSTPSRSVQFAIAKLIGPVLRRIPTRRDVIEKLINGFFDDLRHQSVVLRNGSALGIAGAIFGLGTPSLVHLNVHDRLLKLLAKSGNMRKGALLAVQHLSNTLGPAYDAFALQCLPHLIPAFADNDSKSVAYECADALMHNLSQFGATLALRPLLEGLKSNQPWRSRKTSIELVAAMVHCSPKQLAVCLPQIVPPLQTGLVDAHPVIQTESRNAMLRIATVITNPQIKPRIPSIVAALSDPSKNLASVLTRLLQTVFVNVIDAPSLALVVPVLLLGMSDRRTECRCNAAQLLGGMSDLTEPRVLLPYLPKLSNSLKRILLDSLPMVRATASFALGALLRGLGEVRFPDLYDWLTTTLYSDLGSVERDGAAQGLAQYFGATEMSVFQKRLSKYIADTTDPNPNVREGALGLFSYLPISMKSGFEPFMAQTLPTLLQGLSDIHDGVRSVAMRAAKGLINQYSGSSLPVLLPALEASMFDFNWRIRQSSIQLTGDLIQQILDGEDARAIRAANDRIVPELILNELIGRQQRNSLLTALAMCRQDGAKQVAQRAVQVWKDCVSHSTRALREVVPMLMQRIVLCLGSDSEELRTLGTNTLTMMVTKLDESILTNIFPLLQEALDESDNPQIRQGACYGLCALMETASRHRVAFYLKSIIPCINRALCDEVASVRQSAAHAFDVLCNRAGGDVLDDVIPPLLRDLEDPERKASALEIFRQLVIVRSNLILPRLIPRLLAPPFTGFSARALGTLAEVAGAALYPHLSSILSTVVPLIAGDPELLVHLEPVLKSIKDEGVPSLFNELNRLCTSEDHAILIGTISLWGLYAQHAQSDWEVYIPSTLRSLLSFLTESNVELQTAALRSLASVEKSVPKDDKQNYVPYLRDWLTERLDARDAVPGFGLPKALDCVLPFLNAALLNGNADQRTEAAIGVGQLLRLTPTQALSAYLLPISGPLLRVLGLRYPTPLKEAIFQALNIFLEKGTTILRPLESQLRTTYLKALKDPAPSVRELGAVGLGTLMSIITRVDPLVSDLLTALRDPSNEALPELQSTLLTALRNVLRVAGANTSAKVREQLLPMLLSMLQEPLVDVLAADCLAALSVVATPAERSSVFEYLTNAVSGLDRSRYLLLCVLLHRIPEVLFASFSISELQFQTITALSSVNDASISLGIGILSALLFNNAAVSSSSSGPESSSSLSATSTSAAATPAYAVALLQASLPSIIEILSGRPDSLKLLLLDSLKRVIKQEPSLCIQLSPQLAPLLMNLIKDKKSLPVKIMAERVLLHLLQLKSDRTKFPQHMALLSANDVRNITDYVKRVLVKVAQAASDDEFSDDLENPFSRFTSFDI